MTREEVARAFDWLAAQEITLSRGMFSEVELDDLLALVPLVPRGAATKEVEDELVERALLRAMTGAGGMAGADIARRALLTQSEAGRGLKRLLERGDAHH